jgi:hypothetical protein
LVVSGVCVVAGALLATAGIVLAVHGSAPARGQALPVVDVGRVPTSAHGATTHDRHRNVAPRHGTLPAGATLRLAGKTAPIERVRLRGTTMQIPLDPRRVGWWAGGAAPGDSSGTAVIVGHVNYSGVTGTLATIATLRPGDHVTIAERHRTLRYAIAAVHTYPKTTGIPSEVFVRTGPVRLVLITCGGPFDSATGNYEDNIVAYARPA